MTPVEKTEITGFTIANGVPKVGQLLSAAWNLDSTYRFKILPAGSLLSGDKRESNGNAAASSSSTSKTNHKETADRLDMPPPPSPASSTCSDTGSITTSHSKQPHAFLEQFGCHEGYTSPDISERQKRMAPRSDGEPERKDEEDWPLKDVVFVEDVKTVPIGKKF